MITDDPYELLGVARSADPEVIRAAWLAKSKKHHPDAGTEPDAVRMAAINEAYELLSDPERRQRVDAESPDADGAGTWADDPMTDAGTDGWGDDPAPPAGSHQGFPPPPGSGGGHGHLPPPPAAGGHGHLPPPPGATAPGYLPPPPASGTAAIAPAPAPTAVYPEGWQGAAQLVNALAAGHPLPQQPTNLVLTPGEVHHCTVAANLGAYFSLDDVSYSSGAFIAGRSWKGMAATGAASMLWNKHQKNKAQAQAALQWRSLGQVPLHVTNQRLVTMLDGRLESIWLQGGLAMFDPQFQGYRMFVQADGGVPLQFEGPGVPYASVVLHVLVRGHVPSLHTS